MQMLAQALYSGALFGSIYALMGVGITLIFSSLKMLNLAHGALFMIAGYVAWAILGSTGLPVWLAFALAVLVTGILGAGLYSGIIRPSLGKPGWNSATLVSTIGVATVLENSVLVVFGPQARQLPALVEGSTRVGEVLIRYEALVVMAVSIVLLASLHFFLTRTRYGLAVRAVSQERDAAQLMSVPLHQTFVSVFFISAALAGAAGVLLGTFFFLTPQSGFNLMIRGLAVAIFGGLGSVKGTLWAALLIGFVESFVTVYWGATWALPGIFLFMILVLVLRPNGLFGLGEATRW